MSLLLLFNQSAAPPTTDFLRPVADDSVSDWTNEAGSGTNLYASLDEAASDDADFIRSPGPPNTSVARFKIFASGESFTSPITVRYRFRKTDTSDQKLIVSLKEGTTLIASWTHTGAGLTTSFQTAEQTLTGGQAASISDFDDLYVEFQASPP